MNNNKNTLRRYARARVLEGSKQTGGELKRETILETLQYVYAAISRVEGTDNRYEVLAPMTVISKLGSAIAKCRVLAESGANPSHASLASEIADLRGVLRSFVGHVNATGGINPLKAFLAKFPEAEIVDEESHLYDMACQQCGSRGAFTVAFSGVCEIHSNGTEDCGDHEWDGDSRASCCSCGHEGTIADFKIDGLDDALTLARASEGQACPPGAAAEPGRD